MAASATRKRSATSKNLKPSKATKKINSRAKGADGERELANYLKDAGYPDARRGQQFSGGADSPDVVCPGITEEFHLECKRVEAGNPYVWMDQAIRDGVGKTPIVVHRKNKRDWLVIMRLDDFLKMNTLRGIKDGRHPKAATRRKPAKTKSVDQREGEFDPIAFLLE